MSEPQEPADLRRRAEEAIEELPAETAAGRVDPASGGLDSVTYSDDEAGSEE
jgi:hypothetical protein